MLQIPLSRGLVARVDDDCEWLLQWKWHVSGASKTSKLQYAQRSLHKSVDGKRGIVYMHRQILQPWDGLDVDHIDGDGLNNQRSNLRVFSHALNIKTARWKIGSSGYRGVYYYKAGGSWRAQLKAGDGKQYIGAFATAEAAARAYDRVAYARFGDFAYLNFPEDTKREAREALAHHLPDCLAQVVA